MAILQYRCKKHPKLTRRGSHPTKMKNPEYSEENYNKGKIQYEDCIPTCSICQQPMERLFDSEKGNKTSTGEVYYKMDENFKKRLVWNRQKNKK